MNRERLERLLTRVRNGKVTVPAALEQLRGLPFEDLGFASLDHHRSIRQAGRIIERIAAIGGPQNRPAQVRDPAHGVLRERNDLVLTH